MRADATRISVGASELWLLGADPVHRPRQSVSQRRGCFPPKPLFRFAYRGPPALHVDCEARDALEREIARRRAAGVPDQTGDLSDAELLLRRDIEVFVQSGRRPHRADDAVGDVVDVRQRSRLRARAEDLERARSRQHLANEVGYRVRDAGLGIGDLARAIGIEWTADREAKPMLGVRRTAVHL